MEVGSIELKAFVNELSLLFFILNAVKPIRLWRISPNLQHRDLVLSSKKILQSFLLQDEKGG